MKKDQTRPVRFLLGDERRELSAIDPNTTVLTYLRRVERRVGTKEGCGEGDCGACTVVLAEPEGDRLRYRAVNSCIQFVGALDGKQLLTVEDLAGSDGMLHPCQQALVDCHGSQCGFCTPGFVMSLFALYQEAGTPNRNRIDDALAGNLCRCTGYGPIAAAAKAMKAAGQPDRFAHRAPQTIAALKALDDGAMPHLEANGHSYFAPRSVEQLAQLLTDHPSATILAGGTDVGLWVTKQLRQLGPIIWIGEVAELNRITVDDRWIEIGAAITYTDAMATVEAHYPDMADILRRLGSEQIRNAGTIGGNIANGSPIGDSPPPLIALGSRLVLRRGDRLRELALEDFFLDYGKQDRQPDEFVVAVKVPVAEPKRILRCYKISKRFDQDITASLGAFALTLADKEVEDIRICFGGMAPVPRRARQVEAALKGKEWIRENVEAACWVMSEDYAPITDMRASARYRLQVAQNLLRKFFIETTEPAARTRIVVERRAAHELA
ncbi:xanthine dehydrogenase small subunit [Dongia deserti]|uniref:xanthine dehydrogenase small subunit n=1 Tax=Dongia deserti TaxID=2268030 RepID=UPI000E650B36|nr:xanthine dehydrogenase small subunit [Dongia deserti]